jgi:hypothetical protein
MGTHHSINVRRMLLGGLLMCAMHNGRPVAPAVCGSKHMVNSTLTVGHSSIGRDQNGMQNLTQKVQTQAFPVSMVVAPLQAEGANVRADGSYWDTFRLWAVLAFHLIVP